MCSQCCCCAPTLYLDCASLGLTCGFPRIRAGGYARGELEAMHLWRRRCVVRRIYSVYKRLTFATKEVLSFHASPPLFPLIIFFPREFHVARTPLFVHLALQMLYVLPSSFPFPLMSNVRPSTPSRQARDAFFHKVDRLLVIYPERRG